MKKSKKGKLIKFLTVLIALGLVFTFCVSILAYAGAIRIFTGNKIEAYSDFSKGLTDRGMISKTDPKKYINIVEPEEIVLDMSDVSITEDDIMNKINTILNNNKELSSAGTAKEGDMINIDFDGTIDGESFEGGSTGGTGYTMTIGEGSLLADFESQLIGMKAKEEKDITITFPDDYDDTLKGKTAVFKTTLNGIYTVPELTDDFAFTQTNGQCETVEEYKVYIKQELRHIAKIAKLKDYLLTDVTYKDGKFPQKYYEIVKNEMIFADNMNYTYYSNLCEVDGVENPYADVYEYKQTTQEQYEKDVDDHARTETAGELLIQYYADKYKIAVSDEELSYWESKNGLTSAADTIYGKAYLLHQAIQDKTVEYISDFVQTSTVPLDNSGVDVQEGEK